MLDCELGKYNSTWMARRVSRISDFICRNISIIVSVFYIALMYNAVAVYSVIGLSSR